MTAAKFLFSLRSPAAMMTLLVLLDCTGAAGTQFGMTASRLRTPGTSLPMLSTSSGVSAVSASSEWYALNSLPW